jgi:hypothetical protein
MYYRIMRAIHNCVIALVTLCSIMYMVEGLTYLPVARVAHAL